MTGYSVLLFFLGNHQKKNTLQYNDDPVFFLCNFVMLPHLWSVHSQGYLFSHVLAINQL